MWVVWACSRPMYAHKHLHSGISHGNVSSTDLLQQVGTAVLSISPNRGSLSGAQSLEAFTAPHAYRHANSRTHKGFVLLKNTFSGVACLPVYANRPTWTDHTYLTHQQEQKFAPELCGHHFHKPSMTGSECASQIISCSIDSSALSDEHISEFIVQRLFWATHLSTPNTY